MMKKNERCPKTLALAGGGHPLWTSDRGACCSMSEPTGGGGRFVSIWRTWPILRETRQTDTYGRRLCKS